VLAKNEVGPEPQDVEPTGDALADEAAKHLIAAERAEWKAKFDLAQVKFKAQCEAERDEVRALGGLFILGTERHESRRIDNQLRGRAGRQGDAGMSRFYLSLEDDLMRIFGGDRITSLMETMGMKEDEVIEHSLLSRAIENAQKRVEGHNFDIRKNVLEYDDVMNQQRRTIYSLRVERLLGEREKELSRPWLMYFARHFQLEEIDSQWIEHLKTMEALREGIGLQGYGQKDPKKEYKKAGYDLFAEMMSRIQANVCNKLFHVQMQREEEQVPVLQQQQRAAGHRAGAGRQGRRGRGAGTATARRRRRPKRGGPGAAAARQRRASRASRRP
jgi:preprotein translocase subunit SecA